MHNGVVNAYVYAFILLFSLTPQSNQTPRFLKSLQRAVNPSPPLHPQHTHPSLDPHDLQCALGLEWLSGEYEAASCLSSFQSAFSAASNTVILTYMLGPPLRNDWWLSITHKIKSTVTYADFQGSSCYCLNLLSETHVLLLPFTFSSFCCVLSQSPELDLHSMLPYLTVVDPWGWGCCSIVKLCPTLSNPMDCSTPGFPVLHHYPEFGELHIFQSSAGSFPQVKSLACSFKYM